MSSEIDWSKAPAEYPVWIQDLTGTKPDGSGWHREEFVTDDDEPCERWTDVDGKFWPKDCEARGKIIVHRKPVEPWAGTGLPPVGTVCEAQNKDGNAWEECEVIAHSRISIGDVVVFKVGDKITYSSPKYFRPIRTQAQIEAEEREKAVNAMVATAGLLDKGW